MRNFAPSTAGPALEILTRMKTKFDSLKANVPSLSDIQGRVMAPIFLYMLGVPGGICLLLWVFFFRGR